MDCQAFLDYNGKNERICGNPNARICDQCNYWLCNEHAYEMDGDSAKYHMHTVCWSSQIFEMFRKKKDIPKTVEGVCPRCNDGHDRKKREQPYLFEVSGNWGRVCGLCKSDILYQNDVLHHRLQKHDSHIHEYLCFYFSEIQPRKKKK